MNATSSHSTTRRSTRRPLRRRLAAAVALTLALAAALATGAAQAGAIYQPTVTSPTGLSGCQAVGHAGDQTGLPGSGYVSGSTSFFPYVTSTAHTSIPCNAGSALAPPFGTAVFTLDMQQSLLFTDLAIWLNDTAVGMNGINFRVFSDNDNDTINGVTGAVIGPSTATATTFANVFAFATPTQSRYFHVFASSLSGNPVVTIGEMALHAVPEPDTLALAGLGLIGLGALKRPARPTAVGRE